VIDPRPYLRTKQRIGRRVLSTFPQTDYFRTFEVSELRRTLHGRSSWIWHSAPVLCQGHS
jgi:hypothetical protein